MSMQYLNDPIDKKLVESREAALKERAKEEENALHKKEIQSNEVSENDVGSHDSNGNELVRVEFRYRDGNVESFSEYSQLRAFRMAIFQNNEFEDMWMDNRTQILKAVIDPALPKKPVCRCNLLYFRTNL